MKHFLKAVSLSLILASPLPVGAEGDPDRGTPAWQQTWEIARQQVPGFLMLGQATPQQELQAFDASKYTFWDARVLAAFWNQGVGETKATMGRKLLWGGANVVELERQLSDARTRALGAVPQLRFYGEAYTYQDAEALARFWGEPSPQAAKLRVERKLIMGDEAVVRDALRQAARPAPAPVAADFLRDLVGSRWNYSYRGQTFQFNFGPTSIENFSNGWWPGVSWQPVGPNQVRLWDTPNRRSMNIAFQSPDSFTGNDWDGSAITGMRVATGSLSPAPTPFAPPPSALPTSMRVGNLQAGEILGSRFTVSGQGVPGSRVQVRVEYPKQDILSQLAGVMLRFQNQGVVSSDGNFAIPIDASEVPRGAPMVITISDSANSPIMSVRTEKGADNQQQASVGPSSSGIEKYYDRQSNFGLDIPSGWLRQTPDPNQVLKVAHNNGSRLDVAVGSGQSSQLLVDNTLNELARQGNRVNFQGTTTLGGLPATRLEYTSNRGPESGVVVLCVTARNQTFVVRAQSRQFSDAVVSRDITNMLNGFQINAR